MAFDVSIADGVIAYIKNCDRLTISDQNRILFGLAEELSKYADQFFERNQIPQSENLYWYDYILMTDAREPREFHFVCNAEGHVFGVTEVHFVEECPVDD